MIDKYNLLPVEPNIAPSRTRKVNEAIIGIEDLPPIQGTGAKAEMRRQKRHRQTKYTCVAVTTTEDCYILDG